MTRVHNFSAGPAALPAAVLERASAEMLDYAGTGMSVMEISHRSSTFDEMADQTEACLRRLLSVPDDVPVRGGETETTIRTFDASVTYLGFHFYFK